MELKYRVNFGGKQAETPPRSDMSRLARQLALAYKIERLIEDGMFKDYADVARHLGVSRARVTQIADLRLLPVGEQELALGIQVPAN